MEMTITPIFFDVKVSNTHEVPTTIIRLENLIAKKDAEYPGGPSTQCVQRCPVTNRAGNSGSASGNFATLRMINSVQ